MRQGTQALIKQMWEQIGVETELRNIDAAVFFGGDPASPDTYNKFYADIQMYTNNFDGTDPESYMANWACSEIPGPENQWLGNNIQRQCVAEYDALVAQMSQTAVLEERAKLAKRMNDIIVQNPLHDPAHLARLGDRVREHPQGGPAESVGFGTLERGRLAPVGRRNPMARWARTRPRQRSRPAWLRASAEVSKDLVGVLGGGHLSVDLRDLPVRVDQVADARGMRCARVAGRAIGEAHGSAGIAQQVVGKVELVPERPVLLRRVEACAQDHGVLRLEVMGSITEPLAFPGSARCVGFRIPPQTSHLPAN